MVLICIHYAQLTGIFILNEIFFFFAIEFLLSTIFLLNKNLVLKILKIQKLKKIKIIQE